MQKEFGLEFPLIEAVGEDVPLPDASFDLVASEFGASIWADPYRWIPEAARLLRPGGRLVFLRNSTLATLCMHIEDNITGRLQRPQRGMNRIEWEDTGEVEFQLPHGELSTCSASNGFEIERLIELYAPEGAETHEFYDYVTPDWARKWPAEGDLGRTQALLAAVCVAAVVVPAATSGAARLGSSPSRPDCDNRCMSLRTRVSREALRCRACGRVRIVEACGRFPDRSSTSARRVRSGGLVGLLSIAFHPRYATDRRAYVMYTAPGGNLVVLELRVRGGRARPHRVILSVRVPSSIYAHVGGQLAFGPGGRLHASIGDGLEPAAAQDPSSALGKILRLDVDPPLAPPEVVAIGLRNPWRFSFDRRTGDLFIGDVGERAFEEINVIRRGTRGVPELRLGCRAAPRRTRCRRSFSTPIPPATAQRSSAASSTAVASSRLRVGATSTGTRAPAACGVFAPRPRHPGRERSRSRSASSRRSARTRPASCTSSRAVSEESSG